MSIRKLPVARVFVPLLRPARYKGAHGGRGSGKSHFFAQLLVARCVADPTIRAVCVREVQKVLSQSAKRLIEDKIAAMGADAHFDVLDDVIYLLDSRRRRTGIITFQGMQNHTADSIKSLEGYRIAWVEEAQTISQRSLDLLTPTLRAAGAEIWFSWNPRKADDPVDAFMRSPDAANDNDIVCIEANYEDNPWFAETSLVADMERDRRRDPEKFQHVWRGGYETNSSARVFHNWRVEAFETPADAMLRFGADWGFATDPTTLIRMFLGRIENGAPVADSGGKTLFIDNEAYKVGCEIEETPALFAGDCPAGHLDAEGRPCWTNPHKHVGVPGALRWTITADSARPETVSFMKRKGFRIVPAIKGPGSLEDGIEFLRTFDIVVHPRCARVIEELTLYSWKTDPKTLEIVPILADKDNHLIDAARYGLEALRRGGAKPKPVVPPKRRDYDSTDRGREGAWQTA